MSRIRQVKTTFTAGEVSRSLLGRGDLRAYDNGALALRNVFIQPTGGITRRAGMYHVDMAEGPGRLIAFEFNTEQTYLLVLTHFRMDIYANGAHVETLSAPWSESQIDNLAWTQSADTMLLVHPDAPPKKLTRGTGGAFSLNDWAFFTDDHGVEFHPCFKYAAADVTLTPSGTTGTITLSASANVFDDDHDGTALRVGGKMVRITSVNSPTVVTVDVVEDLISTAATIDWQEQSFSPVRGYPANVAFHQGRLVIGGSRDLPNRLWFSRSGDLFNFDPGTGLDDSAIEFAILSDQVNAIRGLFSGRHLQVFTSGAEWMVTGDPLTPATVQLKRQTRVGSLTERHIPPVSVDGATLFAARSKREVREFIYTDLEQAYQSTDLALLSRHLIDDPVDQDFDAQRRLLYLVRGDGRFATLTVYRAEAVAAWTLHETDGAVLSVAVVGDEVYMLVDRENGVMVEVLEDDLYLDSALSGESETPVAAWSGLDHLEGQIVSIIADGIVQDMQQVEGGQITLDDPAHAVTIGLPYTHIVEPLPPVVVGEGGAGRRLRMVSAIFRVEDTAALRLDIGRGLRDIPLRKPGDAIHPVSSDLKIRALGWQPRSDAPLWRIEQSAPLPFTVLSVMTELKVSD